MTVSAARLLLPLGLLAAMPARAEERPAPRHAVGADISYSSDADDTEVVRGGINLDWRYAGPDSYTGVRLERLSYTPSGRTSDQDMRAYLRLADSVGGWKYKAAVGTDGKTIVGGASVHNEAALRQEYFLERDKIETPVGVSRGLYYTFGGAAVDVPLGKGTQVTLLGGVQEFTGDNVRLHVRGNLVQTVKADWGLSAQLRTRYFRNSVPGEYDYFSPRWYAEVLPVVQVRRFIGGWRLLGAAGLGAQRDSGSGWRASRHATLRAEKPAVIAGWGLTGEAVYTSTPVTESGDYHFVRASLGVTRAF